MGLGRHFFELNCGPDIKTHALSSCRCTGQCLPPGLRCCELQRFQFQIEVRTYSISMDFNLSNTVLRKGFEKVSFHVFCCDLTMSKPG